VPHHNSVFHSVLKFVPWDKLDDAVERHGARGCARSFSFKSQLIALLYGQLQGAASLRDIETGLSSQADRLYHLGGEPARRSSLAEANHDRPPEVFSDLLAAMLQSATSGLRKAMREATYLIDSTTLRLNALSASWARFSDDAVNAKLHVVFDPDADRPVHAVVSAGKVTDITAAKAMPIVPGVTYVFDLGYYDYTWWAKLDAAKCRIVTRLKANTAFEATQTRPVPAGPILSDRIGLLPQRQARNRRNPMGKPVRQVEVRIQTGKVLRIFTNDLDASAQEIADLYKCRWAIELFFRWIKQTLKITRFLGVSENAVRTQIAAALIAFLLLRMAQKTQTAIASPLAFARLVKLNLMRSRSLGQLHRPPEKPTLILGQGTLFAT